MQKCLSGRQCGLHGQHFLASCLSFAAIEDTGARTYHDAQSSDPLPVGLDVAHEADVVVDVVLSKRGGQGVLLILISRPLFHNTEIRNRLL